MASSHDVADRIAGRIGPVAATAARSDLLSRQLLHMHGGSDADAIATALGALIIMIARSGPDASMIIDLAVAGLRDAQHHIDRREQVERAVVS